MSDEITIGEQQYISSRRAAEITQYAQDYIGQLARKGLVDSQRVGGLWYISLTSLQNYKEKADKYTPVPPKQRQVDQDPDTVVTLDGRGFVSASRAAALTGYHQDYVGQLARAGKVLSRQIGNRWYVERTGIVDHKSEKDALLAAVQAESVGMIGKKHYQAHTSTDVSADSPDLGPFFTYSTDDSDLLPLTKTGVPGVAESALREISYSPAGAERSIPIRIAREEMHAAEVPKIQVGQRQRPTRRSRTLKPGIALTAVVGTVVIVITLGYSSLGGSALFTGNRGISSDTEVAFAGNATDALTKIGDFLEKILVQELLYRRSK